MSESTTKSLLPQVDNFILRVLHLLKIMPQTIENMYLTRQLVRSLTELGVFTQEFEEEGIKEKQKQALKKIKESAYVLHLIIENNRFRGDIWNQTIQQAKDLERRLII